MLKQLLAVALERRFFWRNFGFTELSELYLSSLMRVFALSILLVFVPFFMYQNGYSLAAIFAMCGLVFVNRSIWDILSGYMVARFGPKHTLILSCILQIVSAGLFLTIPSYHWQIWLLAMPWGASLSLNFVAYHVAFSKVKHTKHAGKELSIMQIMEKLGGVAGPLIGGVAGTFIGAQYIFLAAGLVLFGSLWPLFQTSEPVRTKQVLNFKDFPAHKIRRDVVSYAAMGIENSFLINTWSLYVALFALSGGIYAKLGILAAAATLISILATYIIGRLVDTNNARRVLSFSVIINALVYLFRPLSNSFWPVMAINTINESITPGYRIPYLKGMYAAADSYPGFRIVYISSMECMASISKGTAYFLLAILATVLSTRSVLVCAFAIAGVASLFILTERFRALDKKGVA